MVTINSMDIWLQIYDLLKVLVSDKVLQSIGNYVGVFVHTDPMNMNGEWKHCVRIKVSMNVGKSLKRRMNIKREGGEWGWVNFKYERLSTFCFVCGCLGHSEKKCEGIRIK